MKSSKSQMFFLLILLFLLCPSIAVAGSVKSASLVIYNSGQALAKETRSVNLPQGMAGIMFKDVPATMDPTSVQAEAEGMRVLDLQYAYVPITTRNILKRYVGKELTVIIPDPSDATGRVQRKATLLSVADKPVFMMGEAVYAGEVEGFLFPEMPEGLQQEPSLTLTADSTDQGRRDVLLSYLMGGLSWRADYTLSLDAMGDHGSLGAWATIENTSGSGFSNASLKLVAGDVNRVTPAVNTYAKSRSMDMVMEAAPALPRQEPFSQFHVYSVDRPVSLSESGTRQISLFSAPKVAVTEELVSVFHGGPSLQRGEIRQNVAVNLLLKNSGENGLGLPMPAGLVRVFRPVSDGGRLLAGESAIPHVGNGGEIRLALGRSFDLAVRRIQKAFRKLGKNQFEIDWEIRVTNASDKTQALTLRDRYPGQWEVLQSDRQYVSPDSGTLEFPLEVPPNADTEPLVVKYTMNISY